MAQKVNGDQVGNTGSAWTDFSGTSTIVGWSSRTVTNLLYKQIGKITYIQYSIAGASNSTAATFTVPFAAKSNTLLNTEMASGYCANSGTANGPCRVYIDPNIDASKVFIDNGYNGGAWTASGSKIIRGLYIYEAA